MMREVIIMSDCKVCISLNFTQSKKKRGAGLKKIKKIDHWVEITHQILGRQNTINEVMNIGFITIMQTLYIE